MKNGTKVALAIIITVLSVPFFSFAQLFVSEPIPEFSLIANTKLESSTTSSLVLGDDLQGRFDNFSPLFVPFKSRNDSAVMSFADVNNKVMCYTFHQSISCVKL